MATKETMRPLMPIAYICALYTQLSMYTSNCYTFGVLPASLSLPCQLQGPICPTSFYYSYPACPCQPYPVKCNDCENPSTCVNASTIPYSIKKAAYSSPRFGRSLPDVPSRRTVDGTCYTYIDAGNGIYLYFRVTFSKTRQIGIQKYLATDVSGDPGKHILIGTFNTTGNSFLIGYEYTIAQARQPSCDTQAFYRCNVYKTCSVVQDLGSYSNIYVLSNSPDGSKSCVKEAQQAVYQSNDRFNLSGFVNPPYNDLKCVCSFNGINVMNRKLIPDQACLTLPD